MAELDDDSGEFEPLAVGKMAVAAGLTDKQIENQFEGGRLRVVQEKNDIFLSHVMTFIRGDGGLWGNLRPEYQRRLRWDRKKKSKLIESFIMNVPVPPVFLYEKDLGRFEVMDGQQRLNAIAEFFTGQFALDGLEIWKPLNGRSFAQLPPLIRRGLERAKISAITLMSDSSGDNENSLDLRAQVFERLNTGGELLNPQELRNSLYSGGFNDLVIHLATLEPFTQAWEIPSHQENVLADGTIGTKLAENNFYKRMIDVEIVLRFFAFMDPEQLSGSVRSMLDGTMARYRNVGGDTIQKMDKDYRNALDLCVKTFEDDVFRLPRSHGRLGKLSRPMYDAEMVAMFNLRESRGDIEAKKKQIKEAVLRLAEPNSVHYELMVGRGNTAATIRDRISLVERTVVGILNDPA